MIPAIRDQTQALERFRSYLYVVVRLRLQGEQQKRIDPSAMVRQTLQDAARQEERLHHCTPAGPYHVGMTAVTCTATDPSGNSASAVVPVFVRVTGVALGEPTLNVPGDLVLEATGPDPNAKTFTLPVMGRLM